MNRLIPALLVPAFLAASGGAALAATAQTAAVRHDKAAPAEARMTRALNLLEANGYGDFSDFKPEGKNFAATVTRGDQHFTVTIDPDAGNISRQG
jgi:uncharacterized cupredoxin-like copper-binding protein